MAHIQPEGGSHGTNSRHSTKKASFSGVFVTSAIVIAVLVGFVAGMRGPELLGMLGQNVGLQVQTGQLDTSSLQEVFRKLNAKFDGKLDQDKLIEYANRGMVKAAGDDYTQYFSAAEAQELRDDLSGNIGGGIGAELGKRNDRVTVIRPLVDSPAARAGIQAGDVIIGINGKSVDKQSVDEVVKKVRGEIGTTVKLAIERDGEPQEVTVTREKIVAPDVESKTMADNTIGVITVSRFDKDTGTKVRASAEELKKKDIKGVILDLRGNGGGFLDAGVDVAGVWLKDEVVVSERRGGKVVDELRSGSNPILAGVPTVVLINAGSASASEIVAGALNDHGAATLIGEQSFGKGSVQELIDLTNGDSLKVTVARWYTPKGKNITKDGIAPSQKVELTKDDFNAGRDPQLDAAIEHLTK